MVFSLRNKNHHSYLVNTERNKSKQEALCVRLLFISDVELRAAEYSCVLHVVQFANAQIFFLSGF